MAYSRYDKNCSWYIFQSTNCESTEKKDQLLSVWHEDFRKSSPGFTYQEVKRMLESDDFSKIPGYSEKDKDLLSNCFKEFIDDVDRDFEN